MAQLPSPRPSPRRATHQAPRVKALASFASQRGDRAIRGDLADAVVEHVRDVKVVELVGGHSTTGSGGGIQICAGRASIGAGGQLSLTGGTSYKQPGNIALCGDGITIRRR